jgi:hypothetical protein
VRDFGTQREALDYLVDRIAVEARRQNVPLSEIERKMLYFSESAWTLPDIKSISAEFDRDYDEDEYERKIAGLISSIVADNDERNNEKKTDWNRALAKAGEGDRYLFVMIDMATTQDAERSVGFGFIPTLEEPQARPPFDRFKLWLMSIVLVSVVLCAMALYDWLYWHAGAGFRAFCDWFSEDRDRRGVIGVFVVAVFAIAYRRKQIFGAILRRR